MEYALLFDFGSTFTKAAVIEKDTAQVVFTTKHPSTVKTDASVALTQCMEEIESEIGKDAVKNAQICASSSAAGGLRMAVIDLTDHLSISAGKNVAFGAGAKIISVSSGMLTEEKMNEIASLPLEMILFCGGYEKRSKTTKEALASGVVAALLYYICIVFVIIILAFNMDVLINPATQQMYVFPAVAAVNRLWPAGSWTYSILIFTGIFSSTIGYLWVLSERVFPKQEETKKNKVFIVIMTFLGMLLAKRISFSMIINSLFPLAGVAGIGVLIGCIRRLYNNLIH